MHNVELVRKNESGVEEIIVSDYIAATILTKYIRNGKLGYINTVVSDLSASEVSDLNRVAEGIFLNNKSLTVNVQLQNANDKGKIVEVRKNFVYYTLEQTGDIIEIVRLTEGYAFLLKRSMH